MTAGPPTAVDETTGQTPGQSPGQAMIGEIEALGDQLRRPRQPRYGPRLPRTAPLGMLQLMDKPGRKRMLAVQPFLGR